LSTRSPDHNIEIKAYLLTYWPESIAHLEEVEPAHLCRLVSIVQWRGGDFLKLRMEHKPFVGLALPWLAGELSGAQPPKLLESGGGPGEGAMKGGRQESRGETQMGEM